MNERDLEQRALALKEEVGERARHYREVGVDYARRAGSSTADFVAENALPLSLIGLGVGWLVLSSRRERLAQFEEEHHLRQRASELAARASHLGNEARSQLTHAGQRSVEYADENPLLVGALAIAAGVGVGLALPATRHENELFGETRDRLLDDAQSLLGEARQTARDVGATARDTGAQLERAVKEPRFSH
jgi:ElaB/YqjD/DUF883 family membrane-anchored ribosome-binding protein